MASSASGAIDGGSDRRAELTEDRIFTLLAEGRRREVLRYLEREGGEAPLSAVTRWVAIDEGVDPDAPPSEYKRVYVSLYQTHVPALVDAGVLEYDPETRRVRCTEGADLLLAYVHFDPRTHHRGLFSRFLRH